MPRTCCLLFPSAAAWACAAAAGFGLAAGWLRSAEILPEPLPDMTVDGFHFPESEAAITGWILDASRQPDTPAGAAATAKIQAHGWGLWTALTAETGQIFEGQRLRVFETWLAPEDLTENPGIRNVVALAQLPRRRTPPTTFTKFIDVAESRDALAGRPDLPASAGGTRVLGFVKYDPVAADHILRQGLLSVATLETLLRAGAQQIPVFPATALVVKPLFQIIKATDLIDGRYFPLRHWSGPPEVPRPAPPAQWPGVVWIDLLGYGAGQGAVDGEASSEGRSRRDETTYPVSSLIHYRLSALDAAVINADKPGTDARAGDTAILVAMHVSSREIVRWTWQTYWWTPTPDTPAEPSSRAIALQRPPQLRGAARNYAMAQAYSMLTPDPPYVGGEPVGTAVYAYNPWIEARFAPSDLPDSRPGLSPGGVATGKDHGVQTNCMSCHAQANFNPYKLASAPRFAGARYVDLSDPQFYGTLQVDFLWSIARHAR